MNKKFLLAFLLISLNYLHSQSIVVNSPNPTIVVGSADANELSTGIEIMNVSLEQKEIKVRRTVLTSIENTTNFFCWIACYTPVVSESPNGLTVNGDSTINNLFSSHLRPYLQIGVSEILYTFFDANNPQDSANVVVRYEINPVGISEISKSLSIRAFPNPADNKVTLVFTQKSNKTDGIIEFYNSVGTKVFTQHVLVLDGAVSLSTESLEPGLYFYLINVGGEMTHSGCLTINH